MRPPIDFAYGNCVLGSAGAWALFALPSWSYASASREHKRELFGRLLAAIEAVEADIQLLRVCSSWDLDAYADELEAAYTGPHPAAHARYLEQHRDALGEVGRSLPRVFLAISLQPPERDVGSYVSSAFAHSPAELLVRLRESLRWDSGGALSAAELERLRIRADEAHARLAAYVDARPARGVEVQWLVRRAFCRGVEEPVVDGLHEPQALVFERNGAAMLAPLEADVLRWCEGVVEHTGRCLRIESETATSWQALLVAGALPERADFPGPRLELMFAQPEALPFPVDLVLCARYLPNDLALRLVRRRVQDADQIARAEADGDQGVSDRGYSRTQHARDLLAYLQSASHPPMLRATLSLAVGAADADELERRVQVCRRAYGEVRLHRPLGDQLELFAQHLPAQRTRVRGYDDVLTPEQVAAMMPLAAHVVGSRAGFYLGHTLTGSRQPVRFNLREGSDENRNAAILSLGALGSGKTTLDQKLAYEGFLLGARIIDCDPKGDHRMHLLEDVAPHVETIALRPEAGLRGLLDPLRVAPQHLRYDAATSFLRDLLPVRADPAWETALACAVDGVMRGSRSPTCFEVVRALSVGDDVDCQVSRTLAVHAHAGLTQLGFADPDVRLPRVGERQVTYIPIRDLPGPQAGTARGDYSLAERVGEQVVRLIAMFAMQLMAAERDRLKLFSFDEGWRLLGDPVGRMLLASLQRMGRSELAVPIISTQLVTDTLLNGREALQDLVGATFVFGLRSEAEAARALTLLGLDADDAAMRRRLLAFEAGRCLMRDHRGRVEAVQVDLVAPWLLRALSTTPQDGERVAPPAA
ncbi:MAG: ATP-binding protein [Solirubrobacteraceae bacterium]